MSNETSSPPGSTRTSAQDELEDGNNWMWVITVLTIHSVILFLAICGNIIVLVVNYLRFPPNICVFFKQVLATLDLLNSSLALPTCLYIVLVGTRERIGPACTFLEYITNTTATASSILFVIIAYDRYLRLCKIRTKGISGPAGRRLLLAVILLSILVNMPAVYLYGLETRHVVGSHEIFLHSCSTVYGNMGSIVFTVYFTFRVILYLTVFVSLIFFYRKIAIMLKYVTRRKRSLVMTSRWSQTEEEKQSALPYNFDVVFTLVIAEYLICYVPHLLTSLIYLIHPSVMINNDTGTKALADLNTLSFFLANAASPIIYNFISSKFRQEMRFLSPIYLHGIIRRVSKLIGLTTQLDHIKSNYATDQSSQVATTLGKNDPVESTQNAILIQSVFGESTQEIVANDQNFHSPHNSTSV